MHKPIKEGREILTRVMDALLESLDAYFPYRGAPAITADGVANWDARQTISKLLRDGDAELLSVVDDLPLDVPLNDTELETLNELRGIDAQGGLF